MQRAREGRDGLASDLHLEVPGWSLAVPELGRCWWPQLSARSGTHVARHLDANYGRGPAHD
jgi:hypothetical protein